MYIEQDFVGPATLELQAQRKYKNRILNHWPRKTVNGSIVFDVLYLYAAGHVIQTAGNLKLYNILGIKVADLLNNNWKGLNSYYLYFKVKQDRQSDLTDSELLSYINSEAPYTTKASKESKEEDRSDWFEAELGYMPFNVPTTDNSLSNNEVISRILKNPYLAAFDIEGEPSLTSLALLDKDDLIFEREFRVSASQLTPVTMKSQTDSDNKSKVIREALVTMKFRKKASSPADINAFLDIALAAITAPRTGAERNDLTYHLDKVYTEITPYIDDDFVAVGTDGPDWFRRTATGYKVSSVENMPAKEFNTKITGNITTGYSKKKAKGWKKLVTVVLVVIIIIVSIMTGQLYGLYAAALVLTAGSLAMMGLSIVLAKSDPAWAAYIGKAGQTLGVIATIVGIINIVNAIAQGIAKEATKKAAEEALKDQLKGMSADAAKDLVKQEMLKIASEQTAMAVIKDLSFDELLGALGEFIKSSFMNTTQLTMTNVLNWATKGFQVYAKYINPPADGLDDLSRAVAEQETQLEDLTGPGLKDKIDYTFSSPYYNIYDFNEFMQGIPHSMTQGKIDVALNKYYDGTTSKVKYRGYLG